jgi:hypothetical protein
MQGYNGFDEIFHLFLILEIIGLKMFDNYKDKV